MSDYIPHHLLDDLLVRLPIDSLIRARCVSKSWRDLIDTPSFTQLHLQKSNLGTKNSRIIALKGTTIYTFDWVREQGGDGDGNYKAVNVKKLRDLPFDNQVGRVEIAGTATDELVLWNPRINKLSLLPPPLPVDSDGDERCWTEVAFGYDHINDDYKVVKWHKLGNSISSLFDESSCDGYEMLVYSLKLNSWRRITDAIPFELPKTHDCVFANGALHWLVHKQMNPD
ncbi:OLC1v1035553C1 [Oldenlandia corymbosa var. corymbosa]|uniref:OLC1v1035553C1 n=1 Tax=Oldenlandia corymbosa var. corymbosa TaxID=529605 RepID=A0AAV1CWD1_OLDCO|nr:OLC1v1035553C1 [Oldenlandia corymbosa var. corymbosa]